MLPLLLAFACASAPLLDSAADTGGDTAAFHETPPENETAKLKVWFFDGDADKWGISSKKKYGVVKPAGYAKFPGDCDDANQSVHPYATETCNGVDDDCDGSVDEGLSATFYRDADCDGYGDPNYPVSTCTPPPGYVSDFTDCDDTDAGVNPAAYDPPGDAIDWNCDNLD